MKKLSLYEKLYLPSPGGPVQRWKTELLIVSVITIVEMMRAEKGGAN